MAMRRRKGAQPTRSSRDVGLFHWRYVYHLVDPRSGTVFYIGKGRAMRINAHDREARLGVITRKCVRIREIWAAGLQVEKRVVALFALHMTRTTKEHELRLIHEFGYENLTNGAANLHPVLPA